MESPKVQIPQVDVIISEPIGVLLVHERMLESFIYARDKFLKPGGAILPSMGTIHLAPFTDPLLYNETMAKVRFWEQTSFYGVDVTPLYAAALDEYFRMPVVGYFDPRSLVAAPDAAGYPVDFATVTMEALQEFSVPFNWTCRYTGLVHGVAGWFDLDFQPPAALARSAPVTMSTGPQAARTHWQQVRLLLQEPLAVNARQIIQGTLHCKVNDKRSYDLTAELHLLPMGTSKIAAATDRLPAGTITRQATWLLHEQTYNHSTYPNLVDDQGFFPELSNLYAPDMTQVGNAASLLPLPPVYSTNDYAEATGDAAAIEVSLQTPVITSPDHSQDSQAMAEDTSFSAV
ncbi:hypothetical protein IWQ60_006712 [Tieghemiomyces parasiticus]|uniref:type I protein arginine methyltransferase n=1 Tax=Tieghemiomyces parasiticus TaxID=78921 RepID=A0A9W8DWJ1_9FUNG|nr:hypothetical protein IWQ60_006712 [Tieghemiomyces parasiticus]